MSYHEELNLLCMEKVAARSYGRNPDGTRRTADQLITQLGGGLPKKNSDITSSDYYYDVRKGKYKRVPQKYVAGNGKYNFMYDDNDNPGRVNFGRELPGSKKISEKTRRQNEIYTNRLPIGGYEGKTDRHLDLLRKLNEKKDNKDTFSGRHRAPRVFGEKAKEQVKKNKELVAKANRQHEREAASKLPYALLGAGLLAAGMAETNHLYNKIRDKREKKKQENKERELASSKV